MDKHENIGFNLSQTAVPLSWCLQTLRFQNIKIIKSTLIHLINSHYSEAQSEWSSDAKEYLLLGEHFCFQNLK